FADADVTAAAKTAVLAAFYNQGEICTAGSRLLVERAVHDQVLEIVAGGAKKLTPGDPLDPATQMGPLVSEAHLAKVMGYIDRGEAEGARREAGGTRKAPGYYVEPTVFSAVSEGMAIAREEIFGPVVSVIPFDDLDEAARVADATEYGLAA